MTALNGMPTILGDGMICRKGWLWLLSTAPSTRQHHESPRLFRWLFLREDVDCAHTVNNKDIGAVADDSMVCIHSRTARTDQVHSREGAGVQAGSSSSEHGMVKVVNILFGNLWQGGVARSMSSGSISVQLQSPRDVAGSTL